MKEKNKILILKIFVPIIIIIIVFVTNYFFKNYTENQEKKPVIISQQVINAQNFDGEPLQIVQRWESENIVGLNDIVGIISENEIMVGIGLNKDDYCKKYLGEKFNGMNSKEFQKAQEDIKGDVYKLNLKTLKKDLLNEVKVYNVGAGVSQGGKNLDYSQNDNQVVCHIESGTKIRYAKGRICNWSQDGNYLIGRRNIFNGDVSIEESKESSNKIYFYDVKSDTNKEILIDKNKVEVDFGSIYSEDGKKFYFIGRSREDKHINGIYKIDVESGKFEEILELPSIVLKNIGYKSSIQLNYMIIDGEKKIVLSGTINGEGGIYIYDVENKKFVKIVAPTKIKQIVEFDSDSTLSGKKEKIKMDYVPYFWISPDETKIAYINKTEKNEEFKWDLCVAKISGYGLSNKITLKKNFAISNSHKRGVQWSNDSKKMYFITSKDQECINGNVVSNDSRVNVVTFK